MRETSLEAYWAIREQGLLSMRRFEVYDVVFNHGPISADDVFKRLKEANACNRASSLTPRFAELKNFGVIFEYDQQKNQDTGMPNIRWKVTGKLPEKPLKRESSKEKIKRLELKIKELEQVIERINCDF